VRTLIILRTIQSVAQLLAEPHLLNSSGSGHQIKRAPCRSRGSEVETPPFDLPYTMLKCSHETLCTLTIFYMRTGREMII
jgi:hypothetical protein